MAATPSQWLRSRPSSLGPVPLCAQASVFVSKSGPLKHPSCEADGREKPLLAGRRLLLTRRAGAPTRLLQS
jgi:hypothetical protein